MAQTTRADSPLDYAPAHPSPINPATQPKVASKRSKRSPVHPEDVYLSRAWLTCFGIGMLVCLAVVLYVGWPAALLIGVLGLMIVVYTTQVEPRWLGLTRLTVTLPNLPPELDGMRVGHLSDSHLGLPLAARNLRWAVEQMRREQPDLVAFTGDFLHTPRALRELPGLLRGLEAPLGVYAVSGNHDFWESNGKLAQVLAAANIELLVNEHRRLQSHGGELYVLGTDDVWDGTPDLERALHAVPANAFKLLLAHTPHDAPNAAKLGIDVQLSGHTHGGHVTLPLLGPLAKPRYTGPFLGGTFRVGNMALFVSRGLGGVPLRLFCRPEAVLLTLRRG